MWLDGVGVLLIVVKTVSLKNAKLKPSGWHI